jgi:hypothetical protein
MRWSSVLLHRMRPSALVSTTPPALQPPHSTQHTARQSIVHDARAMANPQHSIAHSTWHSRGVAGRTCGCTTITQRPASPKPPPYRISPLTLSALPCPALSSLPLTNSFLLRQPSPFTPLPDRPRPHQMRPLYIVCQALQLATPRLLPPSAHPYNTHPSTPITPAPLTR